VGRFLWLLRVVMVECVVLFVWFFCFNENKDKYNRAGAMIS